VRRITEISSFSLVRNLEKNDYLFREGEPCEGFFVVQRGVSQSSYCEFFDH
jgi:CRP-like cAMP-binding protein